MYSGWTRYLFDQFEFPYEVVYAPQLDAGSLRTKYDVIFFPNGALIGQTRGVRPGSPPPKDVPAEWESHIGAMTLERTLPAIKEFLQDGGTVMANGTAASIASQLDLPVETVLTDSAGDPFSRDEYYVPGSILSVRLDTTSFLTRAMPSWTDVMFDDSPVFTLRPGAREAGITRIAWFDSPTPLRSGWAWGQEHLRDGVAIVRAPVGKGTLLLYGPEMNFRGQSHGTFKLLFNGIYPSSSIR
jgi:hypothetical protein